MANAAPDYSIVIPLYNEESCVAQSVQDLLGALEPAFGGRYELVLMINGSTDRTGAICEALARQCPQITLVRSAKNLGYGGGILKGLQESRGAYCGFMCGDGQVPSEILVQAMQAIARGGFDLVKTTRITRGDGLGRRIQSGVYNWLFHRLFPITCRDINAMPKLMRREVYKRLALEATDWFIDAEIMIKAQCAGLQVHEIPTTYLKRLGGSSAVRLSTVIEFLGNAASLLRSGKLATWRRLSRPPLAPEPVAVGHDAGT